MSINEQYHLLDNLNAILSFYKLSARKIATAISRPTSTISRYVKRNDPSYLPTRALIEDLARLFHVTSQDLVFTKLNAADVKVDFSLIDAKIDSDKAICPLYTVTDCLRMAQGEKVEARSQLSRPTVLQRPLDSTMFAYQVLGNGFAPEIKHGDITFCYRYQKGMTLREGTVLLTAIQPKDYQEPVLTFGHLTFGAFGEKAIKYPFEGKERRQDLSDENIIGVVAVNTTEYV